MGSIAEEPEVRDFPSLPPFPKNVPIVPLHRISLENLLAGDKNEEEKLWQASTELGFFYLDLRGSSDTTIPSTITAVSSSPTNSATGTTLLKTSTTLFTLGEKVFELPTEEKVTYDLKDKGSYFGYKGLGAGVIDSKGTRDLNEFWNISKDDILSPSRTLPNPELLKTEDSRALLREFITASHSVVRLVLSILNGKLGLPEGVLEGLHRLEGESGDQVRWVKSPPQKRDAKQVALGEHTDFGSVTVLFNRLGGLQVLLPGEDQEWKYVRPVEGCCVVNLGDALVRFTRGVLRSNVSLFHSLYFLYLRLEFG